MKLRNEINNMKNKINRKGQQEIVGFVLIVVLVMVGLMVFLVISVRDVTETEDSLEVLNMIGVLMRTTSECAIVYEPDYDDFEDLFKSCHKNDRCSNLDRSACDYLNESFGDVVDALMRSEADVEAWDVEFFVKDGGEMLGFWDSESGNCTGRVEGAQRSIVSGGESLVVRMRVCRGS
ncbi:hypothetical protein KAT36_01690 [Candidatus Pacearchaeota archaeon]|nr:hypothetical protein [Candidatus Pacearchaeota archaeon]